jgi:hypothetical protein
VASNAYVEASNAYLEDVARRFHEHQTDHLPSRLAEVVHPDAEMTLLIAHLRPLRGRQEVMDALERGREAEYHSAYIDRVEWLDDGALLLTGQARYAHPDGGIASSRVWWIDEFRDGLLWRVRVFLTEAAARDARQRPMRTHDAQTAI